MARGGSLGHRPWGGRLCRTWSARGVLPPQPNFWLRNFGGVLEWFSRRPSLSNTLHVPPRNAKRRNHQARAGPRLAFETLERSHWPGLRHYVRCLGQRMGCAALCTDYPGRRLPWSLSTRIVATLTKPQMLLRITNKYLSIRHIAMYQVPVAVLFLSTCVGLACGSKSSPNSNLPLNANRVAAEHLNWMTPLLMKDDQHTVLKFDDISTTDGQATIGQYNGLLFEGLTVVNISDSSILDDEDRDCATSHPNTLVSSSYPDGQFPQIKIGAARSSDDHPSPMFDLVSISIKPRQKRSSDYVLIAYKFWQLRNGKNEAIVAHVKFDGTGHHAVAHSEFEKYGIELKNLTAVEIAVVDDSKQDFAFCLDDLGVRIHNMTDNEISG
ncbi:hypothetical protein FB567DRAFT_129376 [Paraphoma chrysanthemicola]|uniref:Uncharacterized protein n=1 Tax=Paraphoma chrysanthemicola TaxID=798071 RepID=A0A8K0R061_9PLEO|nr:hypothetical protein FB567DRAFT_129376 [Paraphoma chrysanthemicola]